MTNARIAATLREIGRLLEAKGESPYKVRAYRRGAGTVYDHPEPVEDLYRQGGPEALEELEGVGSSLAETIAELVTTGRVAQLDALRAEAEALEAGGAPAGSATGSAAGGGDADDEVPF